MSLNLARKAGRVEIRAVAVGSLPKGTFVQFVRVRPSETVAIGRGENTGRSITYSNIVTEWRRLKDWDGRDPLSLSVDAPGSDQIVVIVQEEGPGRILAASVLR